jgi:hypothetical protein
LKPGELMYLDICCIKTASLGGSKFWLLIVDDYTSMKWSRFLKKKDDLRGKN